MTSIAIGWPAGQSVRDYRGLALLLGLGLTVIFAGLIVLLEWRAGVLAIGLASALFLYTKPRHGLMALLALVVVVEGSSAYSFVRPLADMYRGMDDTLDVSFVPLSALEVGIIVVLLGAIRQHGSTRLYLGPSFVPLIAVAGIFLAGLLHGIQTGGDTLNGIREIRAVFYLPPLYLATVNLIRDRNHFRELTIVFIAAAMMISVGALWTHFTQIRTGEYSGSLDLIFAHENAIFGALMVVLGCAIIIWSEERKTQALLALPILLALAAVMVMKRRVGIVALDAGILLLALALVRTNFRLSVLLLPIVVALAILYLGAYWDSTGGLGQGARAFRAIVGQESTQEDKSSKDYRDIEAFNVEQNIRWHPVWGSGFGHKYEFVQPLPDLTGFWPMQRYIPHNTVFWAWMKGGMLALVAVLALFAHALIRGMTIVRREAKDPLLRSWAMAATAAVLMVFLFAWWDLGLVSLRVMTVFGLCLGLLAVIERMTEDPQARSDQS